jgi:hypothetical protein
MRTTGSFRTSLKRAAMGIDPPSRINTGTTPIYRFERFGGGTDVEFSYPPFLPAILLRGVKDHPARTSFPQVLVPG